MVKYWRSAIETQDLSLFQEKSLLPNLNHHCLNLQEKFHVLLFKGQKKNV